MAALAANFESLLRGEARVPQKKLGIDVHTTFWRHRVLHGVQMAVGARQLATSVRCCARSYLGRGEAAVEQLELLESDVAVCLGEQGRVALVCQGRRGASSGHSGRQL